MLLLYVICKRCDVEVLLNNINIIELGNNSYCKIKKSYDVIIDENPKPTKPLGFEIIHTHKKNYQSFTGPVKSIRIQQVHASSVHLKYALCVLAHIHSN